MTTKELINVIWIEHDNAKSVAQEYINDADALEMIANALEKQIPKKPIKETKETGFKDRFICVEVDCKEVNYRCPVCGEPLGTNYNDDYYNEWLNVCNNCFQRIDWESDNQ